MKSKNKSLRSKILLILILFSGLILFFLWTFQVLFLDTYYEWETRKTMNQTRNLVKSSYEKDDFMDIYDKLSYNNNICIEIISNNKIIYSSDAMNRGCIIENSSNKSIYKTDFALSDLNQKNYTIINPRLKNQTLIYALKLNDYTYAYINTSLEPIDSTISILKNQFLFVTIGVLLISIILALYISKKISKPIIEMNESAKKLGKGEYEPFKIKSDIEEVNELVSTLNYASKELSKTDELRKDLMANVSHDLKTPLTMIRAYAEMTRDLDSKDSDKTNKNLNIIIEESERLNNLVNDILDLSLNESNIDTLTKEEFNLVKLIKIILKRYDIYKEKYGYKFIFNSKNKIIVNADKNKIEQVIYNLINNAINYTGKDKTVEIIVEEINKNIKISIKDTGKGIKKEEINNIWNKYYTTNKNHKRDMIGTGLGLSIVKSILLKHDFKYGVDSKKNKGTTFYFVIDKKSIIHKNNK